MAMRYNKITNRFFKLLKKPTIVGFFLIVCALSFEFYAQDFHTREFISKDIRVVDGDTIVLDGRRIRLQGVDAPESKQMCEIEGKEIPCGKLATDRLIKIIGHNNYVECTNEGLDKYKRQLSYCYVGDININRKMVRDGYAVAYSYFDMTFTFDEWLARIGKSGLWAGEFENPAKWRKKNKIKNKQKKK